jgi:hypothetical protein
LITSSYFDHYNSRNYSYDDETLPMRHLPGGTKK